MRFAVIGAGNVGQAIGEGWARKGHHVVYGVPDPAGAKYESLGEGRVVSPNQAIQSADIVAFATPWQATEVACRALDLRRKVVIDCTNPLTMGPDGLALALGFSTSGGELVQSWCPGAFVVKSLNQVGFEVMANAGKLPHAPVMFAAGDDEAAKQKVMAAVRDLGFEVRGAGPLRNARLLEPFAMVWIDQALKRGLNRGSAFGVIHPIPSE